MPHGACTAPSSARTRYAAAEACRSASRSNVAGLAAAELEAVVGPGGEGRIDHDGFAALLDRVQRQRVLDQSRKSMSALASLGRLPEEEEGRSS